ncbi:PREDICTED: zinc finger CCCH domain-containing protein 27-like isoform X1 [Nelumbo nucifera]|uniref:Zinc finger CCCH domain-containing protein 27-like n=2 Tax=Nelumbo nucifera TaxID=4432 RepID=A0A822YTP6_NELNU|nr:PREDICTED: zinc finger CCCH domain-containing protein 27-like isoform X1 [Nelumbo nucifera]DAD34495.1 TPA_asm: hypothetical protein HUJ06_005135 [Nelumbo nucifera]
MIGDTKFEEFSLTGYLVKNLKPLTQADPVILAKYVEALLKKDKPTKELQKLCTENLVEFLGQGTDSFITKLFQALQDGSIIASGKGLDTIKQVEPSSSFITEDPIERTVSSPKPEELSPSSGHASDTEKELSDDDDDRNHKHRRRETRSQSFDKYGQEQLPSRPNRKRNKPFGNGQLLLESDPQSSESRKECGPPPERDFSAKFEKRHPGLVTLPRPPFDLGQRTKVNPSFHVEPGTRLDLSTSVGRLPIGKGRGRSSGLWNQHDSRFGSVETLDFASQMAPWGPAPGLFSGRGLPIAASTQNASWGAFGLIPGMPNGTLDTLHPLGLQGTLRPPSLSIGMPRQRCRDFEERGFCLRGDMCPMEHGVNRIVVEDVQSLSQFNLPVSLPSARLLGMPAGTGPLPSVSAPSNLSIKSKGSHCKSGKSGTSDDGLSLNSMLPVSAGSGEADLYDPDQPLWNTDHPETSSALLRLSPRIYEAEPLWDADASDHRSLRLSDGFDSEHPGRNATTGTGSQTATSVWGRIGSSENKLEMSGKHSNTITSTSNLGNEVKDSKELLPSLPVTGHRGKHTLTEDIASKAMNSSTSAKQSYPVCKVGRPSHKASRTLFVNCIPQKSNKREALFSHFQKFGEVFDIYIPMNSEKAFVQFSRREEAEAALKAPDAVMGNRFIKLWWANRDNIPDDAISGGTTLSALPHGVTAPSASPLSSIAERGKENLPSALPKPSVSPASDVPMGASVHPKPGLTNGAKATAPLQKKLESLELLKEELRIKQEMLAQKRNDFRCQLDKLEKQAATVKGDADAKHVLKRHKVGSVTPSSKTATPRSLNPYTAGSQTPLEKTIDNCGDNSASPNSKTSSAVVLRSPKSLKQPSCPAPVGSSFIVNRFKLDNRPTTFRILPPLPADFANVAVLKEHFSSFSDLSAVELEDLGSHTDGLGPSKNCSVHITFTTRHSAEKAFANGKCWKGHNLQFTWVTSSGNSNRNHGRIEISPMSTCKGPQDTEVSMKNMSSGCSLRSTDKSICIVSQTTPITENGEPKSSEGTSSSVECTKPFEGCQSGSNTKSLSETRLPKADVLIVEGGLNVRSEDLGAKFDEYEGFEECGG